MSPELTFNIAGNKISDEVGYNSLTVKFTSDIEYSQFECRSTKVGQAYGVGIGSLVASFSYTPPQTERAFEVYDNHLINGDGEYRISLFAKSVETSSWNDNHSFIANGNILTTSDGKDFLCVR